MPSSFRRTLYAYRAPAPGMRSEAERVLSKQSGRHTQTCTARDNFRENGEQKQNLFFLVDSARVTFPAPLVLLISQWGKERAFLPTFHPPRHYPHSQVKNSDILGAEQSLVSLVSRNLQTLVFPYAPKKSPVFPSVCFYFLCEIK